MCGIIGIISKEPVSKSILDTLKRLEYRGYDSAGLATLEGDTISCLRAEGKLINLEKILNEHELNGCIGIGHTRWATHGAAIVRNAHPHVNEKLALVHNGIIENFAEIKQNLADKKITYNSDTDTEVVLHLLSSELDNGLTPSEAVKKILPQLRGAFALVMMFKGHPNMLIIARNGPSLSIGYGDNEVYVGSDAIALAPYTNKISYLNDGDWAILTPEKITIYDNDGKEVERSIETISANQLVISKAPYRHFMQKEMYEQAEVVSYTLARYFDLVNHRIKDSLCNIDWKKYNSICFSSCGTGYISTLVAKYYFEKYANISVECDVASEFRYRDVPFSKKNLYIFVSQSGETADTLASLKICKEHNLDCVSVVNVEGSTIARLSDYNFPILAGPEICVASTKAFLCQLTVLAALAIAAGKQRGILTDEKEVELIKELSELPRYINQVLKLDKQIKEIASHLLDVKSMLYFGRGTSYPIALEGALKMKELSYIHAEGYAAGELKHGPIALIDKDTPVVVIAPYDKLFEKTISNIREVESRGAQLIVVTDEKGEKFVKDIASHMIILPVVPEIIAPIIYTIPMQFIAYHTAISLGTDVDQPRNLAKSVTVE
ncbi:glutamine--fructose-6-phosphate transaminase (isomerizing) [Bartonella sp. DGB1]|uniref:glutamine--fructose-6-phosphate transaminase (isomerizing) n=1 Tax=Bartonella sp. DGB1 TaxID=3239807 RepID=UPI003526990C